MAGLLLTPEVVAAHILSGKPLDVPELGLVRVTGFDYAHTHLMVRGCFASGEPNRRVGFEVNLVTGALSRDQRYYVPEADTATTTLRYYAPEWRVFCTALGNSLYIVTRSKSVGDLVLFSVLAADRRQNAYRLILGDIVGRRFEGAFAADARTKLDVHVPDGVEEFIHPAILRPQNVQGTYLLPRLEFGLRTSTVPKLFHGLQPVSGEGPVLYLAQSVSTLPPQEQNVIELIDPFGQKYPAKLCDQLRYDIPIEFL